MKMRPIIILLAAVLVSLATSGRSEEPSSTKYPSLPYKPLGSLAQAIVDMEMLKYPDLILISVHTTPLGVSPRSDKDRMILASSVGKIGKTTGKHDNDAFNSGKSAIEWEKVATPKDPLAPKYGMAEQLVTGNGEAAGVAFIVFHYKEGDDPATFRKKADEILADFKERAQTKDDLLKPAP